MLPRNVGRYTISTLFMHLSSVANSAPTKCDASDDSTDIGGGDVSDDLAEFSNVSGEP